MGKWQQKKFKSYGRIIYVKGCSYEYCNCDNKLGECCNSKLVGGVGFQWLYFGVLVD